VGSISVQVHIKAAERSQGDHVQLFRKEERDLTEMYP
jgi:hypothetical protein